MGICFSALLFEVFELVFCLYDLTLPCIILLLGDGTVFESSIHLVLHGLQLCELIFRFGDSLFKELLFLLKQRGIRRVELQELIDVFKLTLRVFDFLVYAGERFGKAGRIAADFHGYAFYSVSHAMTSFLLKSIHLCLRSDLGERIIVHVHF